MSKQTIKKIEEEQLKEQMGECSPLEREYLLKQYANVCANKRELGLTGYE